jgi:Amt family ammonium transporter
VIGAVPVHLPCGLWGTVAVAFSNPDARLATQVLGAASTSAFMIVASTAVWLGLRELMRLRLTQGEVAIGIDRVETGALAYPEFATRTVTSAD